MAAIDAVFPNIRDMEGLRAEALAARRDGFAGKMAIEPAQVGVINDVFPSRSTPLATDVHHEPRVSSQFARSSPRLLHRGLARLDLGHPFARRSSTRVQTTLTYSVPSFCTRSVRAIIVCALNPHIIGLSTVGPRTTSTAVFAWQSACDSAVEQIRTRIEYICAPNS